MAGLYGAARFVAGKPAAAHRHRGPAAVADGRHPQRPRCTQPHFRTGKTAGHPLLERGQTGTSKGHYARQLVYRFSRFVTPSASGSATSTANRWDVRGHRCGAGMAGDSQPSAPQHAEPLPPLRTLRLGRAADPLPAEVEPARREWFIGGMQQICLATGKVPGNTILYPGNGEKSSPSIRIFRLQRQQIWFSAERDGEWWLNGKNSAAAASGAGSRLPAGICCAGAKNVWRRRRSAALRGAAACGNKVVACCRADRGHILPITKCRRGYHGGSCQSGMQRP